MWRLLLGYLPADTGRRQGGQGGWGREVARASCHLPPLSAALKCPSNPLKPPPSLHLCRQTALARKRREYGALIPAHHAPAAAAAHAGAGIFAGGAEVHDPPVAVYADDGDQHAGTPPLPAWVTGPSAEFLAAAQSEATPVGDALYDGSLHLDAIRAADPSEMVAGRCIVVTGLDEVTIEGMAAEDAGPLLVIVTGDAVIGQPGVPVLLRGGLVVCGRMRVRSEFRLDGTLHAGSLEVDAATAVTVPADWRDRPLPGAARPVVVEVAT